MKNYGEQSLGEIETLLVEKIENKYQIEEINKLENLLVKKGIRDYLLTNPLILYIKVTKQKQIEPLKRIEYKETIETKY